jgi:hypothetical protein
MKLWQLVTITEGNLHRLAALAETQQEWRGIAPLFNRFDVLVETQDRAALDAELPASFLRQALAESTKCLFNSKDGWLRSWRCLPRDESLSLLDSLDRFGENAVFTAVDTGVSEICRECRDTDSKSAGLE